MEDDAYIELTIVSARDIKHNAWLPGADQKVVVAWVDANAKRSTKAAMKGGGAMPEWGESLMIPMGNDPSTLTIEIRSKAALGDVLLGTVYIPVSEIAMEAPEGKNPSATTYQVQQSSGRRHGSLTIIAKLISKQKLDLRQNSHPISAQNPSSHPLPAQFTTPHLPVVYPPLHDELPEPYRFSQPYPPASRFYPPPDYSHPPPHPEYAPPPSYPHPTAQYPPPPYPPPPPQYHVPPYPPVSYYPPTHYPPPPQYPSYPPQYPHGYNPYPYPY